MNEFKKNTVFIGAELAFNLNLKVGDKINLMSSAFVATPFGGFAKTRNFLLLQEFLILVFMNLIKILYF